MGDNAGVGTQHRAAYSVVATRAELGDDRDKGGGRGDAEKEDYSYANPDPSSRFIRT